MKKSRSQKSEARSQNENAARGEDWVNFRLKLDAPNHVALGGARFSGVFRRSEQPFRSTRGEWKVFLQPTGWFEEIEPSGDRAIGPSADPKIARSTDDPMDR